MRTGRRESEGARSLGNGTGDSTLHMAWGYSRLRLYNLNLYHNAKKPPPKGEA